MTNLSDPRTEAQIVISINWVKAIIPEKIKKNPRESRPYKAPGWEHIQMKPIKMLPKKALIQIYNIFKVSLDLSQFPEQWKVATLILIKKPGKKPQRIKTLQTDKSFTNDQKN